MIWLLLTNPFRDQNSIARSWNSTALRPGSQLSPLVHPVTGAAVDGFPETTTVLNALTCMYYVYTSVITKYFLIIVLG
jgi:hypothetical protein